MIKNRFVLTLLCLCMTTYSTFALQGEDNPLLRPYNTPFEVPPFDLVKPEHYLPAIKEAIKIQEEEIEVIVSQTKKPDFKNTIEAFENSGVLLGEISSLFFNMNSSNTSEEIQQVAREITPLLSAHSDNIMLNPALYERVKAVYARTEKLKLSPEQGKLLEEIYKSFVRSGAALDPDKQVRLREINKELSLLSLRFGENVLAETNGFKLWIEDETDLAGLPISVIEGAASAAANAGEKDKWLFTLHNPSVMPFLQYADNRELREKIFRAYANRANTGNEKDNNEIIRQIVSLRLERSKLLGYATHADFILEENMAKKPAKVREFLNELWEAALPMGVEEAKLLQDLIDREGGNFALQPWDWRYYAEKVRVEKYDLDEEALKAYFSLDNVRSGVFLVVKNLFGLQFVQRDDIPTYHEEVEVYEVLEADGSHLGILYMDFHPRLGKRGGAWMSSFRKQSRRFGDMIPPVITIVCNFSRPAGDTPALLTFDEVTTFFHEFGHALHGLLSNSTYHRLAGTSVPRDFVELPSQIMENWAAEPEVLALYARHYQTNEPIPDELVRKMQDSEHFNQGFATIEYLASAFIDMDYHDIPVVPEPFDPGDSEAQTLKNIQMPSQIIARHRPTYFGHIFSGGYSAGYYSYIWAGVLDSDAFQAFKETSLFDQETAGKFRKYILEPGGTEDPMILYRKFRGADPSIEPLLIRRGLKKPEVNGAR
jgi:peptidyl-dipeptidase Dcp